MYPVTVHVHLNDPTCSVFQLSFLALSTAPFECTDILYKHTHIENAAITWSTHHTTRYARGQCT